LKIEIKNRTETKKKEEFALKVNGKKNDEKSRSQSEEIESVLEEPYEATEEDHAKV
jgi:hypothetical protein